MSSYILPPKQSHVFDRSQKVTFFFEGREISAHHGETIASALLKAGVQTFSRSFKYHRARGLLCVNGRCPNCLMTVDGFPSVRSCSTPVQNGMKVSRQNAWPSVDLDFVSVLDKMDRLMPVGFYYKAFHKPKFMWRLVEPVIRRAGGLATLDTQKEYAHYEHYNSHTDVAVIGAGPAGLAAAIEAAREGAHVTLIDDQPSPGGHLLADLQTHTDLHNHLGLRGYAIAQNMAQMARSLPDLEVMSNATAFGLYDGNLLGVVQDKRLIKLRAKAIVVASGCNEVPFVFPRNDLPGVMLSTGIRRLVNMYGVKPGQRALVLTNNDRGYTVAQEMLDAGVEITAIADSRPDSSENSLAKGLACKNVPIITSSIVAEAVGSKRVKGAVITSLNGGQKQTIKCDLICMSAGFDPLAALLYQAGAQSSYDEALKETVPTQLPTTIFAAGEVTGIHDVAISILQGKITGLQAAAVTADATNMVAIAQKIGGLKQELGSRVAEYKKALQTGSSLVNSVIAKKKFVCFCEDVTEKDLKDAIAEGFDDMQTLKRYSTLSMGPCQGKMCLKAAVEICAEQTGRTIQETGSTTSRPPAHPVPMSAIAGPGHFPIKLSPLDNIHRDLNATMMDMGPWKRPQTYGSPQEECKAVRQRVGIIDVSTLGKLDVQGRDAPALLDKVYTHKFSNLSVGRIRYGILCSDSGMIIDDGTVTRLSEDRYFITTTTGNIDLMEEWLKWWSVGGKMCVHVTNVTPAYAAINVAGPKARDTLMKLTNIDLSAKAFPYMKSTGGLVAGVPSILLRIGFVGETGWEVHFPAEYAEYMWNTLMEAGKEFGIAPFAVEAQRILRLEKKHIIIGQDTDIVSNPLEGGIEWAVRFDKEGDFVGRHALETVKGREPRDRLVGFVMEGEVVPPDGVPVVMNGKPIGRVTSSRLSAVTGRGFGLAWVPAEFAKDGTEIFIQVNDKPVPARVSEAPIYDPEGERLRS